MNAQGRPEVDQQKLDRARHLVEMGERPLERYVREEWETAVANSRIALDALRKVYPVEIDTIDRLEIPADQFDEAVRHLEAAYTILDRMLPEFWGALVQGILAGVPDDGNLELQEANLRQQLGPPYSEGEGPLCLVESPYAGERGTRCLLDFGHEESEHDWAPAVLGEEPETEAGE